MKRVFAGVLALVLAAVLIARLFLDLLVKRAIEQGATRATGLPAEVRGTRLGLWSGELTVNGPRLGNPEGFETPYLLRLARLKLALQPRSLLHTVIRAPLLVLDDAQLNLERNQAAPTSDR